MRKLLDDQQALHMEVWSLAWSVPLTTFDCQREVPACTKTDITAATTKMTTQVTRLNTNLSKLLSNSCISKRKRTATLRRRAKVLVEKSAKSISLLGTSVTKC